MKIAYIGGSYVPSREANSMHQMRMAHAFASLGHDVTLHVRPGVPAVADDFAHYGVSSSFHIVKHRRPNVRVYGAIANALTVAAWFGRHGLPELVYGRETYGMFLITRGRVPFIYESHWKPKTPMHKALETALFRRPGFRGLVLISDALRQIYEREYPWLPAERVMVAHDAADPIIDEPRAPAERARLSVGYVGGFLPGYGLDIVVELARRMPDADFHVVGGKEHELREWKTRAATVDNLVFHGFVAPGALPGLYAEFDVMLAPYQRETKHIGWISPMKLFEYMAHGKAIVCSDFPVMREILDHETDALLVAPEDVAAWISAIERLADRCLRNQLAARARQKLESEFTWRRRAERVLGLCSTVAEDAGARVARHESLA